MSIKMSTSGILVSWPLILYRRWESEYNFTNLWANKTHEADTAGIGRRNVLLPLVKVNFHSFVRSSKS